MFRSVLTAVALAALASAANAAVLSFKLSQAEFPDQVINPGTSFANISVPTFGTFNGISLQATTTPVLAQPGLLNSLISNGGSAFTAGTQTLHIFVTTQNVTALLEPEQDNEQQHSIPIFSSVFDIDALNPGVTLTEQTFIDPANGQFTTPHLLGSFTLTGPTNVSQTITQNTVFSPLSAPYSLTEEYTITTSTPAFSEGFIFLSGAVPEPSTWAMMLVGFVGLGFAFRRSRRKAAFA
jgi:hypothetical protein